MSERNFTPKEIENIRAIILKMFASKNGVGISDNVAAVFSEMEQEKLAEVMRRVPTSDVQTPADIANNITNAVRKMFETKRSDEAILNDIRNGEIHFAPVKSVEQIGEKVQSVAAHTTTVSTATNVAEGVTEAAKSVEQGAKEETAEMGKVKHVVNVPVVGPITAAIATVNTAHSIKNLLDSDKDNANNEKEGLLDKVHDFVNESVHETGEFIKNNIKEGIEFFNENLNPFASNNTLNNAGQKVNPDATEQTTIAKDNSKGMA